MLQLGRVVIEDDVEIGANCAIDRGAAGDTLIGAGTVIDNLVQIGHNVRLGRNCILCGQVGIAGSTEIGDGVIIGGQSAISDHLTIGAGARIAGKSGVMREWARAKRRRLSRDAHSSMAQAELSAVAVAPPRRQWRPARRGQADEWRCLERSECRQEKLMTSLNWSLILLQ